MKLREILEGYEYEVLAGSLDIEIEAVENDSRKLEAGSLFIAEVGYTVDGHDFIEAALEKGAQALIVERDIKMDGPTVIKVESSLDAMAFIANKFYNRPWSKMHTIGITGTNGKTSTTYFIKSILDMARAKVGIIGTIGSVIDNEKIEIENTTPNSLVINKLFNRMVEKNIDYGIMEVSSHALALKRVEYMEFETAIFMNLAKDHLDYHKTVENYFQSKLKLFSMTNKSNIINIDDDYGRRIIEGMGKTPSLYSFGLDKEADVFASQIKYSLDKVEYRLNILGQEIDIRLNIPGEFSIYNSLAAAACAYSYGIDLETIKAGLENIEGVKGRFEVVPTNTDYTVIIDFAHTAEGLRQVLHTIEDFAEARKIVVFGAGGNRDKTKRPEMGEVVGRLADIAIVTSDNPRNEEPEAIIEDVVVGVEKGDAQYVKIVDRIEAIHHAIDIAEKGDIVLLAGKGHETYTLIKGRTIACDERQIVLDYLER